MTSAYEAGTIPVIGVQHRLRIAREFAGLEQADLAEMVGISRTSVSNAESGKTRPRKITLNAWALATGVPVTWLQTGEAPADPDGGDEGSAVPPAGLEPATCGLTVRRTVLFFPSVADAA